VISWPILEVLIKLVYTLGFKREQLIFPEIDYEEVDQVRPHNQHNFRAWLTSTALILSIKF
jgi:hypothetical protein